MNVELSFVGGKRQRFRAECFGSEEWVAISIAHERVAPRCSVQLEASSVKLRKQAALEWRKVEGKFPFLFPFQGDILGPLHGGTKPFPICEEVKTVRFFFRRKIKS